MNMDITFLKENQIWGDKALQVMKSYGTKTGLSDLAIVLGGAIGGISMTSDNQLSGDVWSASSAGGSLVSLVRADGNWFFCPPSRRMCGARPALPSSVASSIKLSEDRLPRKISGVDVVEYGEYPQTIAPDNVTNELEQGFSRSQLKATGKKYTFDGEKRDAYDKPFSAKEYDEYQHSGKRYIRVEAKPYGDNSVLSNGKKPQAGEACWIEVKPIEWLKDPSGVWVARQALFAGGPRQRLVGARPALPSSVASSIKLSDMSAEALAKGEARHGDPIKDANGKVIWSDVILYGEYPQTIALDDNGKEISSELEQLFSRGQLQTTGKKYTFDSEALDAYDKPFKAKEHAEYEKRNVEAALAGGEAPHKPSVNLPETSLLWAINLAYLAQKKDDQNFYDSKLWKQFASPDGAAQTEKERLAFYVATTGLNKDTRICWEPLGSSYYYHPRDNRIGADLILALGVGFDIARLAVFHEIGHSKLLPRVVDDKNIKIFGEKIAALDEQIEGLRKKGKETSLTQDEYKHLRRISNERHYRYLVADEAENNPTDRWAVNQGRRIRKDHVLTRNQLEAILVDGLIGDRDLSEDTPANRFQNTKNAVRYSFFRNNGYFPDTEDDWRALGINPDWITTKDGKSGMEALEALKELCGGKDGVENLQPDSSDMMMGAVKLAEATLEYSRKRNKRIEEIYDTFFAHVVEPLLQAQDKKLDEQMKQKGSGQNPPPPDGDKQDGQGDEKGDGKGEGKEGDGQGTPQQGGEGAGGKPKEGGGKGGGGAGDGAPADGGEEPLKVDGMGEMPGVDAPPTTPKQEGGKPGAGKPAGGADPDPGQTIEELEKARTEREGREGKDNDGSSPSSPSSRPGSSQGFKPAKGIGTSNVASQPKVGDWSDYQSMVVAFASEIRARQVLIDQLRARQLEYEARIAPEHTLLPVDGDTRRLDRSKHTQLVKRILRGQPVEESDAQRFDGDKFAPIPSNMDVVLLVDGSVSMHESKDATGKSWPFPPIKAGMHAGCVMNEACKNDVTATRHANFYLGLWGNAEPLMLVKPGDDKREIGRRIAGIKQNQSWGTSLAPSIRHITAQLAEGQKQHSGANSKTGYSHIIILSDGGIADSNASFETVRTLLENCPMTSVDFVIVENGKTALDDVASKLKDRFPGRVGVHPHNTTATVSDGLETLLLERIQNTPIAPTVTREHKRATLERAHHAMQ